MSHFWLALGFLTTLPVRPVPYQPAGLARAAPWFPAIGLLLGLLLAGVYAAAGLLFPPPVVAVLVLVAWAATTGALHLDGLADCCDGLLASVPAERRLAIMRDPRTGAFAVVGLVLLLLSKATLLAALAAPLPALLLAPLWARWLLLWAARQAPARKDGLGSAFGAGLTPPISWRAAALPVLVTLAASWFDLRSLAGVLLAGLATVGVVRLAEARIGGVTGDVLGAVVEVSEAALLLAFAAHPV